MSDVNSWLADYYGTEKTASYDGGESEIWHLFKAAAAEDGIDAEALDDEEIDALADYYMDDDDDDLPPNWDGDDVEHYNYLDDAEKTAFVQFKEAEFLGQVMAHSMDAELDKLASTRMDRELGTGLPKGGVKPGRGAEGRRAMARNRKAKHQADAVAAKIKAGKTGRRSSFRRSGVGKGDMRANLSSKVDKLTRGDKMRGSMARGKFRLGEFARANPRLAKYGPGAAGALAAGGLAAGAYHAGSKKTAGAYWTLAEVRANDFIKHAEAGYEYPLYEGDPIDEMAYELLEEHGYI